MLQTLFAQCLAVSLAGTAAAVMLGLLHLAAGRMLGVKWQYYSWLPVLLVLLAAPLLPLPQAAPNQTAAQAMLERLPAAIPQGGGGQVAQPVQAMPQTDWLLLLGAIWLAGIGVALCRHMLAYRDVLRGVTHAGVPVTEGSVYEQLDRCRKACGVSRPVRLYRSAAVDTPLLAGVFHPVIVLPDAAISEEDLRYIFAHELTHCRRNDLAYKWLAVLVCSLHWFNPAAHWMLRSINQLCELSCDESVIAGYDTAERREYMQTILRMLDVSVGSRRTVTTAMSAGGRMIEKRLRLIHRNRRPRRGARMAGFVLTLLFTAGTSGLTVTARAAVPEPQAVPALHNAQASAPRAAEPAQSAQDTSQLTVPVTVTQEPQPKAAPAGLPVQAAVQTAPVTTAPQTAAPSAQETQPQQEPVPQIADDTVPEVPIKYTSIDGEEANYSHNFSLKPGVDLETIRVNAERGGRTQNTDGLSTDLTRSYQIADYAVEGQSGAQQTVATVTPDENGLVTVYLDSEYADWLYVNVVDTETGETSGQSQGSIKADPTLALSFPGLEEGKSYDVVIESTDDTDHTITGTAIVY